jgi:hypothetical protein
MKFQVSLLFGLVSTLAFAQQGGIGAVKVEPNPAKVGQEVKITIAAEGEAPAFCGMVVHFDDGSESRQVKIDGKEGKFPVTITKTYAKAGSYSIKAEGRKITTHFPCVGNATAKLTVEGAAAPAKAAAPACPEGYKMSGKAGKAGDFSCKGGKDAKAPAQPLACGDGLEYFSNDKSKQLGCRKAKAKK